MLYATRNTEGKISGITDTPSSSAEAINKDHPDVRDFFSTHYDDFSPDSFLDESDIAIARILDDLVDLLVVSGGIEIRTAARAMAGGGLGDLIRIRDLNDKRHQFDAVIVGPGRVRIGAPRRDVSLMRVADGGVR